MKKLLVFLMLVGIVATTSLCSHTRMVYRLWETTYFGDSRDSVVLGTFGTLCECREAMSADVDADMREAARNGPSDITLGQTMRFCEEGISKE